MDVNVGIELINTGIVYKPGWTIRAEDYTWRMQGAVLVHISFAAPSSDREDAREGYQKVLAPLHNAFPMVIQDCVSEEDMLFKLLKVIIALETHEAREFLRRKPTYDAPFHPHRMADMVRWSDFTGGSVTDDLNFGAYAARPGHLTREVNFTRGRVRYTYRVPVSADTTTEADARAYDPNPMASNVLPMSTPPEAALLPVLDRRLSTATHRASGNQD